LSEALSRHRGGIAGNIAYSLGLLGQPCRVVGTVGNDFDEYRAELEVLGVDVSGIVTLEDQVTASAFITTDRADNQITGFFPGAMAFAGEYSIGPHLNGATMAVVSPTAPAAMVRHVAELKAAGVPYLYDPGQQVVALTSDDLRDGIEGATMVAGNDYEIALIEEKTELSREDIVSKVPVVVVTFGDLGSTIYADGKLWEIPTAEPWSVVDPTGAGDGYRAGLLAGYSHGLDWETTGRLGATVAAFVAEQKGTQAHSFTVDAFRDRVAAEFLDRVSEVAR